MTQPRPGEQFEPYPWTLAGEPGRSAAPEPPNAPEPAAPLQVPPPRPHVAPSNEVATPRQGVNRRALIGGLAGAGALIAVGAGGLLSWRSAAPAGEATVPAEEMMPDPELEEGQEEEWTLTFLSTPYGDLEIEVPTGWEVADEGDLLLVVGESSAYRIAAHVPDRLPATEDNLLREASYLRDEFDPAAEPTVNDESIRQYDILELRTQGTAAGIEATEQVTFIGDPEAERGLVVSLTLPVELESAVGRAARGMVDDLLKRFQEL